MKKTAFSNDIVNTCKQMGLNLKDLRINSFEDTQETMATRLGVSLRTYSRMEAGDPTVKIGTWLEAAKITRQIDRWISLFTEEKSLFDQFDQATNKTAKRKRVRKT
ncbi:helix-turn-helix protein [Mariprofundus ferrinatatus]|uniref:Helix-turn-helix protein n=1 Tax=Mariprofundus ferrinatatus TaxID=1921087 RepID=A0A2K8L3T0_9PROT|nr:helix-turn-helix transcriptional regulator [Mariprofundus ferrinatatus]ATX81988.1 helix-turn-helix protein [Mariprofundus ferrinatatus]